MKKLILSTIFLTGSLAAFSQTFTQANEPMVGDSKLMFVCDSFATDYAGIVGNGVTWDYSTLSTYNGATKNVDILTSSTTPFASDFPNSTKTTLIENFSYTYYTTSATNRVSQGYVLEGTDMGDVKAKFSSDDQILMNYPMTMNAYVDDAFGGNLSFVYNTIPQNPSMTGNSHTTYDGIGTLVQPDGSSIMNVSRFHIQDTAVVTVPILGTSQLIRSQYEYYDLNGTDFMPVFLHMSAKVLSGFPDPLIDETVVLSIVSGTQNASLNEHNNPKFTVYPNPAKDLISIKNIPVGTNIQLIDVSGRIIDLPSTVNTQYNISGFNAGIYMLQFETENGIQSQTLVIE